MSYLSVSVVAIHCEEALYQVYAPLPLSSFSRGRWVSQHHNVSIMDFIGIKECDGDKWSYDVKKL